MSIDQDQVAQAVRSLVSFEETNNAATSSSADPTSYGFWMIITTKLMPDSSKVKPHRMCTAFAFFDQQGLGGVSLTKDPQREYKNLVAETGVSISKVIGLSKLKAKYTQYEAKRKLCASYDLFLADERIVTLLPPLLGKATRNCGRTFKKVKREIESALGSAFFYPAQGFASKSSFTVFIHRVIVTEFLSSVKVGKNFQTPDEVVANICTPAGRACRYLAAFLVKGSSSRKSTSQKDSILVPAGEEGVQKEMKKTTEKNSSVSASRVSAKKGKVEKISNIVESPKPVAKTTKAALKVTKKK
ncbi:ribosomal protein L1p/L10e family-domain-containing protein [Chytridium lagenaria]|nr:ribosomal protein L1p/L10e family-domain-containing protein [Chytridium lagenaria]